MIAMSIYRGHLGEISNKADWQSPAFQFVDTDTGEAVNLSDATAIYFEIKHPETLSVLVEATLNNGKIEALDDNRFQVLLTPDDLSDLCAGQYLANFSFTLDDVKTDAVLANISILEGAG